MFVPGPWVLYRAARRHLADGTVNLATDGFKLSLYSSASNASDLTLSTLESVSGWVASQPLISRWQQGVSAGEQRFTFDPVTWRASAAGFSPTKFAVVARAAVSVEA